VEGWKRKAVRRYAQAQDRKWRKWMKSMFEKGDLTKPLDKVSCS